MGHCFFYFFSLRIHAFLRCYLRFSKKKEKKSAVHCPVFFFFLIFFNVFFLFFHSLTHLHFPLFCSCCLVYIFVFVTCYVTNLWIEDEPTRCPSGWASGRCTRGDWVWKTADWARLLCVCSTNSAWEWSYSSAVVRCPTACELCRSCSMPYYCCYYYLHSTAASPLCHHQHHSTSFFPHLEE